MVKLCLFFLFALFASEAVCMNLRHRRQTTDTEDSVDERYGWDRPAGEQFPRQGFPGQGFFPNLNLFPDQGFFPNQNQFPNQQQQTSSTTALPDNGAVLSECIRRCPVTPEYNPVCGTNHVTYQNQGGLSCAQACGVSVSLLRLSRCPPPTTAAPNLMS